jgi:hypothetical protein
LLLVSGARVAFALLAFARYSRQGEGDPINQAFKAHRQIMQRDEALREIIFQIEKRIHEKKDKK